MAAAKKAPAKKKPAAVKTKYYAAVVPTVVNVEDNSPLINPIKLNDKESITFAENDPSFVEITKQQFDKLEDYVKGSVFGPLIQEVRALDTDGKRTAGDWIMDILIFATGMLIGALVF